MLARLDPLRRTTFPIRRDCNGSIWSQAQPEEGEHLAEGPMELLAEPWSSLEPLHLLVAEPWRVREAGTLFPDGEEQLDVIAPRLQP